MNIIHTKFSLLSSVVASGLDDFKPLSEGAGWVGGGSSAVECVVLINLPITDGKKKLVHALFLQIFLYGKHEIVTD
ncbi:hypothetical protein ACNKHU_11855 [Shigella flexneri]